MNPKLIYAGIAIAASLVTYHVIELKRIHNASFDAGWEGAMGWVKDNHENLGHCPHFGPK